MWATAAARVEDLRKNPEAWKHFQALFPKASLLTGSKFATVADVAAWVAKSADPKEGEFDLRVLVAFDGLGDETSLKLAQLWLQRQEEQRVEARADADLREARRASVAAERSARWTVIAAGVAAVGAVITAIGAWTTASAPQPVVQVYVSPDLAPTRASASHSGASTAPLVGRPGR